MAMQLSPEQQQMLEQQKANCPFCKIVKGEIEAKKVYEDEFFLIVLDINPAARGHMLLVPKEHYPIMPVIPAPVMEKLFVLTQEACRLCYTGMVMHGSTVFIANGAAAGQQSAHFLMHVIPRDKNDGVNVFEVPRKKMADPAYQKIHDALRNNVSLLMRQQFGAPDIPLPQPPKKEYIKGVIEMNKPLLEMALSQPEQFKKLVQENAQLKELFREKNVDEIVSEIREKHGAEREGKEIQKKTDTLAQEEGQNKQQKTKEEQDEPEQETEKQGEPEKEKDDEKEEEQENTKQEENREQEKQGEKKPDLDDIARLFA